MYSKRLSSDRRAIKNVDHDEGMELMRASFGRDREKVFICGSDIQTEDLMGWWGKP